LTFNLLGGLTGRSTSIKQGAASTSGRRVIAALGDSRTSMNWSDGTGNSTKTIWTKENVGSYAWAEFVSRGSLMFPQALSFGLSGHTTAQMLARADSALVAAKAANAWAMIVWGSTNDRGLLPADGAVAQYTHADKLDPTPVIASNGASVPNLDQIVRKVLAAGLVCILVNETPRGSATYTSKRLSATELSRHMRVRQWINDWRYVPGVIVVDPWPKLADYTATNGDIVEAYTYDGLHFTPTGAFRIGTEIWNTLKNVAPAAPFEQR
jgi:lysophospholipase L1-like esterase